MMLTKERMTLYGLSVLVDTVFMIVVAVTTNYSDLFQAYVISDKAYVFFLAPVILLQLAFSDSHFQKSLIVRMRSRVSYEARALLMKAEIIVANMCIWFLAFFIVSGFSVKWSISYFFGTFVRFLLGFFIMCTLTEILRKVEYKPVREGAYLFTEIILAMDVTVIARGMMLNGFGKLRTILSQIFSESWPSYTILGFVLAILLLVLFRVSLRRDIL